MRPLLNVFAFLMLTILNACFDKPKPSFDDQFEFYFQNCVQIVSMRQGGIAVPLQEVFYAHSCLYALTGIESAVVKDGDSPFFYPYSGDSIEQDLFLQDLLKWNHWLVVNRGGINVETANNILQEYSTKIGEPIRWPKRYDEMRALGY